MGILLSMRFLFCIIIFSYQSAVNCQDPTTPDSTTTTTVTTTTTTNPSDTDTEPSVTSTTTDTTTPTTTPTTTTPTTTPTTTTPTTTPTTTVTTTTIPPTPLPVQKTSFRWTGSDLNGYNSVVYSVDPGYYISVTVSNVTMSDGNFLLIMGGDGPREDATDGRVFANSVKGPLSYLFRTSSVYAFCQNNNGEDFKFTVEFEQAGELTTTVITSTTTPLDVPPTEPNDSVYITVNVTGNSFSEYNEKETTDAFKKCVVTMAENYCKEQNINLLQTITTDYVLISDISHCPYTWPDSTKCVQITFKLPIFHDEAKWHGYQLNSKHLEVMWLRYAELDNSCFKNNKFEVYTEPNIERAIIWWAIGISFVIVVFVVLLWFLRMFSAKINSGISKRKSKTFSDTFSNMSRLSSRKDSISSLTPHYLQDHMNTPKFFDD